MSFIPVFAIIVAAYATWKPLTLFLVPGIFLLYSEVRSSGLISTLVFVIAGSLSFWTASFWPLEYIHISLTNLYYLTLVSTLAGIAVLNVRSRSRLDTTLHVEDWVVGSVLIMVGVLRFMPYFTAITPAGADMSMHSYITALITNVNGVPKSYRPFLAVDAFDTFPVGFHTVSALIALLGEQAPYRSAFIVTCMTYTLLTCSLFLLVRNYGNWRVGLITALWFSFLLREPQGFIGWGGNPTIFALVFVIFFILSFLRINSRFSIYVMLAALFLDAVLLTHTIVFVEAFYALGASFLAFGLAKRFNRSLMAYGLTVGVLFLVIALPYLASMNEGVVTPATIAWIKNWVRNTDHAWHGSIKDFYWSIPVYIYQRISVNVLFGIPTAALSLYGMAVLYRDDRASLCFFSTLLVACMLLILNARYWILPLSFAIYPERVASMTIIPLGVFFSCGLSGVIGGIERLPLLQSESIRRAAFVCLVSFFVLGCYRYNSTNYLHLCNDGPVSKDDMAAFEWMAENTSPSALIESNYGDAGLWIPAIAHRRVTNPHINVAYLDKIERENMKPDFVFVGSRCVYLDSCQYKPEMFLSDPSYKLVFQSNNTYIFQKE